MIARALSLAPSIIPADEPVSMVDASLRSTILEALGKMNRADGIALIYVTDDLTAADQVADILCVRHLCVRHLCVRHGGQVMEAGAAEAVIHRPRNP